MARSRAESGSSKSRTFGSFASARTKATRWAWPPESSLTRRDPYPGSCTSSSSDSTRSLIVDLPARRSLGPKAMFSATDKWGNKVARWNTRFTGRLFAGRSVTSSPKMRTLPSSGTSRPATMRSTVVLPHPLGPSRVTNSPSPMARSSG